MCIVFSSGVKYERLKNYFPVNILASCLSPSEVVHNLAVLFESKFIFTNQMNSVIKSCFANAYALVSSYLNYFNSMFLSL